jgi:hypothetical protein
MNACLQNRLCFPSLPQHWSERRDEHTMDLLVVAPDGTVISSRVHGAVLICVKTAAILAAVLSLDALREEDYMRLVKMSLEPKDRITALYQCHQSFPCSGKPAVIFHDRGKIFTGVSGPGRYWLTAWVSRQSKGPHRPHQRKGRWKLSLPGSRASLPIVSPFTTKANPSLSRSL